MLITRANVEASELCAEMQVRSETRAREQRIRAGLALMPPETRDAIRRMCETAEIFYDGEWLTAYEREGEDDARKGDLIVERQSAAEELGRIVAQCDAAGVPVFVKQDSGYRSEQKGRIPDHLWARKELP